MVVDAGVEAEADGAADSLGHLALVHGAQTRLRRSLDPSVRRHELGDHGEVLLPRQDRLCVVSQTDLVASLEKKKRGGGEDVVEESSIDDIAKKTYPVHIEGLKTKHIDEVAFAGAGASPLAHLGGGQVVRGVDVAGAPAARHLAGEIVRVALVPQLAVDIATRRHPRRRRPDDPRPRPGRRLLLRVATREDPRERRGGRCCVVGGPAPPSRHLLVDPGCGVRGIRRACGGGGGW